MTCLSGAAFGDISPDTKVKFDGLFHFQSGFRNQGKLVGEEKNVSGNRKSVAFFTEAALAASIEQTADNGLTYGGKVVLLPTTNVKTSPSYNGSHLFVESEFGKVEAGSPYDAGSKMRVTGYDVSAATGDDWGRFAKLDGVNMKVKGLAPEFADYIGYFFDAPFKTSLGQLNDSTEPPRLISYFTPKYDGFQAGISYIPDSSNVGGSSHTNISKGGTIKTDLPTAGDYIEQNRNVRDSFAGGMSYERNLSDGVDIKVALTGEYGRRTNNSKVKIVQNNVTTAEYKVNGLATYNLGAILTYGNFTYGLSYGSLGKSLTAKEYNKTGRDTRYYNGAIAYGQGPIKTSLTYFKSTKFKNTVDVLTLGSDYKLTPGLVPYAEVSVFQAKGRPSFYPTEPKKKVKGTVALIGAKLQL